MAVIVVGARLTCTIIAKGVWPNNLPRDSLKPVAHLVNYRNVSYRTWARIGLGALSYPLTSIDLGLHQNPTDIHTLFGLLFPYSPLSSSWTPRHGRVGGPSRWRLDVAFPAPLGRGLYSGTTRRDGVHPGPSYVELSALAVAYRAETSMLVFQLISLTRMPWAAAMMAFSLPLETNSTRLRHKPACIRFFAGGNILCRQQVLCRRNSAHMRTIPTG
jgi:hypothetical protein